jgi:8-oxo-dGTP pyrophosphatase MutT (NUDIX family)
MLIIGSQAAIFHKLTDKKANDTDVIGTFSELQSLIRAVKEETGIQISRPLGRKGDKWHIRDGNGWNIEFEIAFQGTSAARLLEIEGVVEGEEAFASKQALLALKMSHRYLRNSPHFLKTMRDIQAMRAAGIVLDETMQEWLVQREEETYDYAHPNLNVDKGTFFDDSVKYIYDHDSIHETVAITTVPVMDMSEYGMHIQGIPAYTKYMKDGAQVMTDKEKFFSVSEMVRLHGVYEESCVLALERSQIPFDFEPNPRYSFELALMKVCTSITSGWFREYAWENYDKVLDLYLRLGEDNYIERFKRNAHLLKPFKGEKY